MVGPGRVELPTSRLSGVRSNHLSYGPIARGCIRSDDVQQAFPGKAIDPDTARVFFSSSPAWRRSKKTGEEKRRRRRARCFCPCRQIRRPERPNMSKLLSTSRERKCEGILRKEVIQPQVPLRLPCYDFTPVADPTVVDCLLAVSASPSGKTNSHGVTGGVYKARERIHRGVLIRDY